MKLTSTEMGSFRNLDETLAAKFLAGEATPEEAILVNEWIESSAENKLHFKELEAVWALETQKLNAVPSKSVVWRSLQSRLEKPKSPRVVILTPYRIAAIILLLIMAAAGAYFLRPKLGQPELVWNSKQTREEITSLNLSDGTSVTLNRNTKILWPTHYATSGREVKLEGEAFFDVQHDPSKPFIISTGEIKIKVLGTSFNVWQDQQRDEIKTDVTRGKVMMYNDNRSIVIEAGMIGVYHKSTKEFTLQKMADQNTIGYVTHSLSFSNATLDDISGQLTRAYGVQFVFENEKLRDCRLTTEYENKSLTFILNVIEESLNIKYRIENNRVYISGDGCL